MTTLSSLIDAVEVLVRGSTKVEVTSVECDSRKVVEGTLFAAISGGHVDGRDFIEDAVSRGASCVLTNKAVDGLAVTQLTSRDVRKAFGLISAAFFGNPASKLRVVGITGTNGKTTVAYMIESILGAGAVGKAGVGVMGTINYRYSGSVIDAPHTTPMANDTQRLLRDMATAGVTHTVMEVSSHALSQKRVEGVAFDVCVFTNLTPEHLDYHTDMDGYFEAKKRLFTDKSFYGDKGTPTMVINADDEYGSTIIKEVRSSDEDKLITYSLRPGFDISPTEMHFSAEGIVAKLKTPIGEARVESKMVGEHNLYNIMAAVGAAIGLGSGKAEIEEGIRELKNVPGRLERVASPGGINAFVDYAHTPDALERTLEVLNKVVSPATSPGRLITVFGCGGDRDTKKRPLMGRVAKELSSVVIVTSDNPRTEEPDKIISDIEAGMDGMVKVDMIGHDSASCYTLIPDRRRAIEAAVSAARPGDTLLIAGKGHEDYQIKGREKTHFDDREILTELLKVNYEDPEDVDG